MEKQELLDLFNNVTAPTSEPGVKYISESGFLVVAEIITSRAYRQGMLAGFDEMENALTLMPLANEINK